LIVTGGVAPNRAGKVSPLAGKMSNWHESRAHRDVTEAVHAEGGLICMQILHSGRYDLTP
jgi:2,4-dienoyl-CoA reductase (NADPH2)